MKSHRRSGDRPSAAATDPTEIALRASALNLDASRASLAQRRLASALLGVLLLVSLAAIPLSAKALPSAHSFIALFGGITTTTDLLTAALLFGLYGIDGRRTVLAAATAYLTNALLTGPYILTFPDVMGAAGVVGNGQSAAWLWMTWHTVFPVLIVAGVLQPGRSTARPRRARNVTIAIAVALVFATLAALIVTAGKDLLPALVEGTDFTSLYLRLTPAIALANVGAFVMTIRRVRPISTLHLWILVALASSTFDVVLNAVSPGRFRAAWYVGKFETLVTASVVLMSLLVQWSSLYARATDLAERLSRTLRDRRDLRERFERERTIAEALQEASLPRGLPIVDGAVFSAVYRQAVVDLAIGGDWYDAFLLEDGRLVLTIGDVAGKGLAASVVMARIRQTLRVAASLDPDPRAILALADRALRADDDSGLVTAFVAVVDHATGTLSYASAGHPPPLIYRANGTIEELAEFGLPLGLRREDDPPSTSLRLDAGDLFVAYTDGLVEVEHDLIAGTELLRTALAKASVRDAPDPASALYELLVDGDAKDDVAIVTLALTGTARTRLTTWRFDTSSGAQAASARRTIAAILHAHGATRETVGAAECAFGELVGNAVRYAPGPLDVSLELEGTVATLQVRDRGPGFSTAAGNLPSDPLAESGRGLYIVRACARSFAVMDRPGGGSQAIATFPLARRRAADASENPAAR